MPLSTAHVRGRPGDSVSLLNGMSCRNEKANDATEFVPSTRTSKSRPGMNQDFWKRKLAAYLHDPPSKCVDIATHEQRSDRALTAAGFSEDERRALPDRRLY